MRVLHVIPSLSPRRGGPSAALPPMLAALNQAGVDARVLTTNDDGPANNDFPVGQWFDHQQVSVMAFPRRLLGPRWFDEHIVSPQAMRWLTHQGGDWDLLHVHAVFSYLSTRSMRWARRVGKPFLCRPLGQLCRWSLGQKAGRKRVYLKWIEQANLRAADRVHFTSDLERRECADAGIKVRPMVVPHGITLPSTGTREFAADRLSVLFMSRLDPKKGLERLIQGFVQALPQLGPATLTIAGSGDPDYQESLSKLAASATRDLADPSVIRFTGWVDGDEKAALLLSSDVFVLPSYSENFGVAVLEALAWGLPVLITPEVALADAVASAGAGVVTGNRPQQLAAALTGLRQQPLQAMSAAGQRLAREKYSWQAVAAQLKDHYHQVLESAA